MTPELIDLFRHLQLSSDELSMLQFVRDHQLLPNELLWEASFWNEAQRDFLYEAIYHESHWCASIYMLDGLIRASS